MGLYDDDECTQPMCTHHDTAKHKCDHLDAIKRTWIHLKNFSPFMRPGSSWITLLKTLRSVMQRQESRIDGLPAENPCYCKRRQTVHAATYCLVNDSDSSFEARDVSARPIEVMQATCQSSRLLVIGDH
ncbi:hypothetical protein TNCV_3416561 [Trichonephila clavipes]|nr:hypothetical protein TNCV_3416561 [Trichonephila clavipes]